MKNKPQLNLSHIGELALLKKICSRLPERGDVIAGAGDDCAVVRIAGDKQYDYLLKSDSIVENVHFNSDTRPELIGHKALGRVLSDMAAMGGEPLWVLIDLVAPPKAPAGKIEKIYAGINRLAGRFKVGVVGGDVSAGRDLQLHVFGVGRVKKGKAVLRSRARIGDKIYVTGSLGGSLAGKHLNFQPRLREGKWLAENGFASAMIDISDGLLRDLGHLTEASGVGARIDLAAIPISYSAVGPALPPATLGVALRAGAHGRLAEKSKIISGALQAAALPKTELNRRKELHHALTDGEDYELLFTVPARKEKEFVKAWQRKFRTACTRIGRITLRKGRIEGIDSEGREIRLSSSGFEHFK
jgi:thiamine-monophosphate kinase